MHPPRPDFARICHFFGLNRLKNIRLIVRETSSNQKTANAPQRAYDRHWLLPTRTFPVVKYSTIVVRPSAFQKNLVCWLMGRSFEITVVIK